MPVLSAQYSLFETFLFPQHSIWHLIPLPVESRYVVPSKAVLLRCKDLPKNYDEIKLGSTLLPRFLGVAGQVHRLKLMKWLAYGRASFSLLRLRVLHGLGQKKHQKQQKSGGTSPNLPSLQNHKTREQVGILSFLPASQTGLKPAYCPHYL